MLERECEAAVCEGVDTTLGLCEETAGSGCGKLITPFQFASNTCEDFRLSKLSGIGMQVCLCSETGALSNEIQKVIDVALDCVRRS